MRKGEWSDNEEKKIIALFNEGLTNKEISEKLGRASVSVYAKLHRLELRRSKAWTREEMDYITDNYDSMTHKDIAKHLGRTEQSVRSKISWLNVIKRNNFKTKAKTSKRNWWEAYKKK